MQIIHSLFLKLSCIGVGLLFFVFFFQPVHAQEIKTETYEGVVVEIKKTGTEKFADETVPYQELAIELKTGKQKGEVVSVKNSAISMGLTNIQYEVYEQGDRVKVEITDDANGNTLYALGGKVKRTGLIILTVLFIMVVLIVGRVWGALSLVGLVVSFFVIFQIVIPMIIDGNNPVLSAVLGAIIIVPTTFYISHGFNKKTHIGVITTIFILVVTGILAGIFIDMTHLTGYASEEAGFLQIERYGTIDIRGLLLAGIIIGALGILDDVTIGQASTVEQLKKANKYMTIRELFSQGMKVGQDHISSMVNTLMLVYSGSALPLLLLFFGSEKTFGDIIEFELIAEEIVRMLVGSIGLVLAAPLATLLAAYVFYKYS